MSDEVRAFIEGLQPYNNTRVGENLLGLIRLWNQDKHQLIHLWGVRLDGAGDLTIASRVVGGYEIVIEAGKVLQPDAPLFKIIFDRPQPLGTEREMKVQGQLSVNIAMQNVGPVAPDAEHDTLWSLYDAAACTVGALLGAIGRQNIPSV